MPIEIGTDHPAFHPSDATPEPETSSPAPSSTLPPGEDINPPAPEIPPPAVSVQPPEEVAPDEEEPAAFDERCKLAFEGLLYVGKLTDDFEWLGHRFNIHTLRVDELLAVGDLHRPFIGSLGENKAYQAAIVAACVDKVDGKPVAFSLTNDKPDLDARFNYIKDHWYAPVLDAIYEKYLLLEIKVNEVIDAMGKA